MGGTGTDSAAGADGQAGWVAGVHREIVRPEWVDYNGHMNVAFYVLIFDHATDAVLDRVGLGEAYRQASECSVFVAEAHVTYEAEVRAGEAVTVRSRILASDRKRLVLYHEMRSDTGALAASNEVLCVHVDLRTRRSAPMPATVSAAINAACARSASAPQPSRSGRAIALNQSRPR